MPIQETSLEKRALGTLAFEYEKQVLRYEDAKRALARLEREQRDVSHYAAESDDAQAQAVAVRAMLIKKLREHDLRLGIRPM